MRITFACLAAALTVVAAAPVQAQEPPARPWSNTTELGYVLTTGNAESSSLNFGNKYLRKWDKSEFGFDVTALRAETTDKIYTVDGDNVLVDEDKRTTAEMYTALARFRRDITPRFYWFLGAGWLKNEISGIDSRITGGGGLGYAFVQNDRHRLRGELGVNYTSESYVTVQQDGEDSADFAEARAFLGYEFAFSKAGKFTSDLGILDNLDTTSDWRANWVNAVTASLSERIALKVGYTVLYDNRPAYKDVGGALVELDDTDTIFTTNLVVNF